LTHNLQFNCRLWVNLFLLMRSKGRGLLNKDIKPCPSAQILFFCALL